MATELVYESVTDFTDMIENQDYELAKIFAESMLSQIYNTKKVLSIAEIYFEDLDEILEFKVNKEDVIPNLKQFLYIYETEEDYEGCAVIAGAIKTLECLA